MTDFETLVQIVTEKVIEALVQNQADDNQQRLYVSGTATAELVAFFDAKGYQLVSDITTADALCLNELSVGCLRRVALMTPYSEEEETIVAFLLKKQAVFVIEAGRTYQKSLADSPYSMKKELVAAETKWQQFGAEFIKLSSVASQPSDLKLLSVSHLMKADYVNSDKILVNRHTIITPLAKDFIREHNLQLIYNRNEE